MKAKNREINIVNMSLLDILTGALGAFLFLMLGMMPAYIKQHAAASEGQSVLDTQEAQKQIAELEQKNAELRDKLKEAGKADAAAGGNATLESKISTLTSENDELKKKLAKEDVGVWDEGVVIVTANKPVGVQLWALNTDGTWEGPKDNTPWGEKSGWVFKGVGLWSDTNYAPSNLASQIGFVFRGTGLLSIFCWVPPGTDVSDLTLTTYTVNGAFHKTYASNLTPPFRIKEAGKMNLISVIDSQSYDTLYYITETHSRQKEIEQYVDDYIKASPRDREKMRERYVKLWTAIPKQKAAN
jgi:hypothetical protein